MEHVFKMKQNKPSGRAFLIITDFINISIVGLFFYFNFKNNHENANKFLYLAIVILIFFLIIMYKVFIKYDMEYIVTDTRVIFMKKGKEYKSFPYSECIFSSWIVTEGIKGTKRYLLTKNEDGEEEKYFCSLGKKDFNEFMSLISAYSNKANIKPELENVLETMIGNKEFTLNKEKIWKKVLTAAALIWSFIYIVFMVILFVTNNSDEEVLRYLSYGGIVYIIMLVLAFSLDMVMMKKKTPDKINLRNNSIYIDDDNFNLNEVERIILTPYKNSLNKNWIRLIKITKKDGTKVRYNLGFKVWRGDETDTVFPKYEEFCCLLEERCLDTPGKFQYELF